MSTPIEAREDGKPLSVSKGRHWKKEAGNSSRCIFFKSLYRGRKERQVYANRNDRRHEAKLSVRG